MKNESVSDLHQRIGIRLVGLARRHALTA